MAAARRQHRGGGFGVTKAELAELVTAERKAVRQTLKEWGGLSGLADLLHTSLENGLSKQEVEAGASQRKEAFGVNELPEPPSKGFFSMLWEQLTDTTIIILTIAAIVSLIFGILLPEEGEEGTSWIEGAAILVAVIVVTNVGAGNNYAKERQFRKLDKEKQDKPVEVLRGGNPVEISSKDLMVGDIALLNNGERIPADGFFIDGRGSEACSVDNSVMTGETVAVHVTRKSPVMLSGSTIAEGLAKMLVIAVGEDSQYGQLFKKLQEPKTETPLESKLDSLATWIGWGGLGAAVVIFVVLLVIWIIQTATGTETLVNCVPFKFMDTVYSVCTSREEDKTFSWDDLPTIVRFAIIAITIVVVAVPEGLPLAVTLSLAYSMKKMMNDNCLVRRLAACETMGGATNICSDKTGTLTENRMTVVQGWVAGQKFDKVPLDFELDEEIATLLSESIAVNSKADVVPAQEVEQNKKSKNKKASRELKQAAAAAPGLPVFLGNKTECALLVFAGEIMPEGWEYRKVRDQYESEHRICHLFNFTSDRKRMSTVVRNEKGDSKYRLFTKGASETILEHSQFIMEDNGSVSKIDEQMRRQLASCIDDMANNGLRTIGLAFRDLDHETEWKPNESDPEWQPPENNLVLISLVGIEDPIREAVPHAVQQCQEAGIFVRMVTGDNLKTAKKIAKDCGILTEGGMAMEGPQFRNLSDSEIDKILPKLQVLARSIPSDKQRLVERLKENREVVAVTGDGTNDGPALKAAHVGLAMGLSGTDVAKQASDIVILDDNFKSIVMAVMWGRCVYDNIKKFLQFQLTVNFSALLFALIAAMAQRGTPLYAVQLLWVNLIMDTMAALALGTEKPTPDLLKRKPYGLEEKVPISAIMYRNIVGQGLYQLGVLCTLLFAGSYILGVKDGGVVHYTMIFNTFVWMQVFNEINSRKVNDEWNVFAGIFTNWLFLGVLLITVVLQTILVQFGGEALRTTGLNWYQWLICIGLGAFSIPLAFIIRLFPIVSILNCIRVKRRGPADDERRPLTAHDDDDEDDDEEDDEDLYRLNLAEKGISSTADSSSSSADAGKEEKGKEIQKGTSNKAEAGSSSGEKANENDGDDGGDANSF
ncbi:putative Plasma membrane calcium-transporting ATPase 1 [Balamuthia mandrillaris]